MKAIPPWASNSFMNAIWCGWIFWSGNVLTAHSFASKQTGIP